MTNSTENIGSLKKLIGAKPVEHILTEASNGSFSQNEAETFAYNLHPKARGALINTKIVLGREAMELILSFWFEWGEVFMLTKVEALCKLISALKEARKNKMVFEIQGMCSMGSQDTTDARAGIAVASDNSPPVHPPSAPTKMVTDLPSHPYPIPGLTKAPTGTTPVPSDQGTDPVCASHAIGKSTVAILDDCGFNMVNGHLGQHKVIEDLIQEVQPDKKAKNPDEFHQRKIKVDIFKQSEPEKEHKVEIQFDVQTDWTNKPKMTTEDMKEKKISMVLRYQTGQNGIHACHAIYSKEYTTMGHSAVNSWGSRTDPYPQLDSSVYAIDYIQITEI